MSGRLLVQGAERLLAGSDAPITSIPARAEHRLEQAHVLRQVVHDEDRGWSAHCGTSSDAEGTHAPGPEARGR